MSNARIQFSTAEESVWNAYNPTLKEGEVAYVLKDNKKVKMVIGAVGGSAYKNSVTVWDEDNAETLATRAETGASNASASATAAATSATNAAASAGNAKGYASTASAKATAASTSATAAASSATSASGYAANAKTYASNASTSEGNAKTYASNAATSATNASGYATTATNKATAADKSAQAAATSASSASTYAGNASTSASNAADSATAAAASATSASGYADTASAKATAAANSASAASTSASTASSKAGAAATSATNAATSENNAKGYASTASSKASAAATSATNAAASESKAKEYSENVNVFIPSVSVAGVLSWTNKAGLDNPTSVNIKGEKGDKGDKGDAAIEVDSALSTTSTNPVQNKVITNALAGKADASALASVATSGSYNDLTNKPTIPSAYTLPTATASVLGGVKVGSNITVSSGTISLTKANVTSALGYIPPTTNTTYSVATTSSNGLMSSTDKSKLDNLATVATSGYYDDLYGTPTLATVATSGSYDDLRDKPNEYVLPEATADILGGVKVGDGLSVLDGVLSASGGIVAANLAENGYIKFANGLIVQWGLSESGLGHTIIFPIAFSKACYSVTWTALSSVSNAYKVSGYVNSVTTISFYVKSDNNSCKKYYIAIGV